VAPAPVARVPLLNTDVHDLDNLATIADLLSGGAGPAPESSDGPSGRPSGGR